MSLEFTISKLKVARSFANGILDRFQSAMGTRLTRSVLAVGDQLLVSGARFVTTVILGRVCGARELGEYGLAFTFIMMFGCLQESLITLPYTVYWTKRRGRRREIHAGSILLHFSAFCAAAMALLAATSLVVAFCGGASLARLLLAVTVFLPGLLFWEFLRRVGFAHLRVRMVFLLDFFAVSLYLLSVGSLALAGWLTPVTAYMVMGTILGSVALLIACHYGQTFRPRIRRASLEAIRNWRFGRWIMAGEAMSLARGHVVPWLVAAFLGTSSTGVLVAYLTILALARPLQLGISNVLAPELAVAYNDSGACAVRHVVHRTTLGLGAVTLFLAFALVFLGEPFVGVVYGRAFTGYPLCAVLLALGLFVEALGIPSFDGLWSIGRSDVCFAASAAGLIATGIATVLLIPLWGLAGAAAGICCGRIIVTVLQCVAFQRCVRDAVPRTA